MRKTWHGKPITKKQPFNLPIKTLNIPEQRKHGSAGSPESTEIGAGLVPEVQS